MSPLLVYSFSTVFVEGVLQNAAHHEVCDEVFDDGDLSLGVIGVLEMVINFPMTRQLQFMQIVR